MTANATPPNSIYNFGAGPSMLPREVMQQIHDEWFDWHGTGLSAIEWSHRDPRFEPMLHETAALIGELLAIPKDYKVLFMQGGASLQWSTLPMNLAWGQKIGYAISGLWSEKAYKEGKNYSQAVQVANAAHDGRFNTLPPANTWQVPHDVAFVHYCSNETIQGIQYPTTPTLSSTIPLVSDMSSDILSRPFDISPFAAIYAGAQKNIGIAGVTILIIREDWLDRQPDKSTGHIVPATLNLRNIADNQSLLNTPCTFAIYVCNLMAKWLKKYGGTMAAQVRNHEKASMLYAYLDQSDFYQAMIEPSARSLMNVTFRIRNEDLHKDFVAQADAAGLKQLKGHRLQGGLRASIYNAMPKEGVATLIAFMDDFAKKQA